MPIAYRYDTTFCLGQGPRQAGMQGIAGRVEKMGMVQIRVAFAVNASTALSFVVTP